MALACCYSFVGFDCFYNVLICKIKNTNKIRSFSLPAFKDNYIYHLKIIKYKINSYLDRCGLELVKSALKKIMIIISTCLKVRSHQMRMKRYAQIIDMLSQCKDVIDNPAYGGFAARFARVEKSELWQIFAPR